MIVLTPAQNSDPTATRDVDTEIIKTSDLGGEEDVGGQLDGLGAGQVGHHEGCIEWRIDTPQRRGQRSALGSVVMTVDADDDLLEEIVAHAVPDLFQLHGSESPDRIAHIKQRFKLPVMKAVSISTPDDILTAHQFETSADLILFDAKPPKDMPDALPGGNGLAFDWGLIAAVRWKVPWLLSGGLTADNVNEAINTSGTTAVDVSSGVEREPGNKDPDLIRLFLNAAKQK